MFCHDKRLVFPDLFDDSQECDASKEALEEFRSAVIVAYEQALEEGISANAAFSAMLDLMAAELKRSVHFSC